MPGLPQRGGRGTRQPRARSRAPVAPAADRRQAAEAAAIRVKVATQPTFTRYVFALPDMANVVPERGDGKLTLDFDQPIKWDLADAKAAMPTTLKSIESEVEYDSVTVTFALNGTPKVRTFREDRSIVVDVGHDDAPRRAKDRRAAGAGGKAKRGCQARASRRAGDRAAGNRAGEGSSKRAGRESRAVASLPAAPAVPPKADGCAGEAAEAAAPRRRTPPPMQPGRRRAQATGAARGCAGRRRTAPHRQYSARRISFRGADAGRRVPARRHAVAGVRQRRQDRSRRVRQRRQPRSSATPRRSAAPTARRSCASGWRGRGWSASNADGPGWIVTIGDASRCRAARWRSRAISSARTAPASPFRSTIRASSTVLADRDIGDRLMVVTALGPARGFLKEQNFVELRALPSTHGVVLQPLADDVSAELGADKITISRPGGLSLSPTALGPAAARHQLPRALTFDTQLWGFDRQANFNKRQAELIRVAAVAPASKRRQARLQSGALLSRARHGGGGQGRARRGARRQEAAPRTSPAACSGRSPMSCSTRPDDALKELANPQIGNQLDAPIWRAIAYARQGKWAEAHAAFKTSDAAMSRAADRIAAHGAAGGAARGDRGARFRRRRPHRQRVRHHRRAAGDGARDRRADRPARRRRSAATRTRSPTTAPPPPRTTAAPPRKAACARSCCALRSATCRART